MSGSTQVHVGGPGGGRAAVAIPILLQQRVQLPPTCGHDALELSAPAQAAVLSLCGAEWIDVESLDAVEPGVVAATASALDERGLLGGDGPVVPEGQLSLVVGDPAAAELERPHQLVEPVLLRASALGFDLLDHDGAVVARLTLADLELAQLFHSPATPQSLLDRGACRADGSEIGGDSLAELVSRLVAAGLMVALDEGGVAESRDRREFRHNMAENLKRAVLVDQKLAEMAEAETERERQTGTRRTRVVPVNVEGVPMLSLGMVMSYAMGWSDGELCDSYVFVPDWMNRTVPSLTPDDPPAIYLFSNYLWSHRWNLSSSQDVKDRNPNSVTVHGGPDTPKYRGDVEDYFAANPHIDVAVHGEGEVTGAEVLAALRGCLGDGPPDLSPLRDVPGLSFRDGDEIVTTESRERLADLDTIPSPFLNGLFDVVGDTQLHLQTIETNRGCPYGCTYCDWGSATLSRIRKFDLDRVLEEIEWCGRNKASVIFVADANFGIFERDVEIARKVVEVKRKYGYPRMFESSYAKNTVKHLKHIIEVLAEGDVLATGTLALQTLDDQTLGTIHRSNIKTEKYDDLAAEFGRQRLRLVVDLMLGLPGSTTTSLRNDLQACVDREVRARVSPTELLVNSPMNEPSYREEHAVEVSPKIGDLWRPSKTGARGKTFVVSSATFTRDDYQEMLRYRRLFLLFENFGVLRQLFRFVRQESGRSEIDLYAQMDADVLAEPTRWPAIATLLDVVDTHMIPPLSWRLFVDDVRAWLVDRLGLADDSALATAVTVQHALLPARGRRFPLDLELEHDFAAWFAEAMESKRQGHMLDWETRVPRLAEYGPATLTVDDPQHLCDSDMGYGLYYDGDSDWEMDSAVNRHMSFRKTVHT